MTFPAIIALMLFFMAAVMGIRHGLRARCLGKCEGCPHARSCAAKKEAAMQQHST